MFFILSKISALLIKPLNLIFILYFLSLSFKFFKKFFLYNICYILTLIFFIFSCILPTGNFLLNILEKNYYENEIPKEIDGIIVLGGAIKLLLSIEHQEIQLNGVSERLIESAILKKKFPDVKFVFTGGNPYLFAGNIKQADVAKDFYIKMEVDTTNIIFESNSRNTYENLLFSKEIVKPKIKENWLVVTSAFHMPRTLKVAKKLEWNLIPYAVDFKTSKKTRLNLSLDFLSNISQFNIAMHEFIGIIVYYFTGKIDNILLD